MNVDYDLLYIWATSLFTVQNDVILWHVASDMITSRRQGPGLCCNQRPALEPDYRVIILFCESWLAGCFVFWKYCTKNHPIQKRKII